MRKRKAQADAAPWVEGLGRFGIAAAGGIYVVVAVLAIGVALDLGGEPKDGRGALEALAKTSLGSVLLFALGVGFGGYALWRFAVAAFGHKLETAEDLNPLKRAWYAARGTFFAYLCWKSFGILTGARGEDRGQERRLTAEVLTWPGGRWIVGAAGLAVVAYGLGSAARGLSQRFDRDLKTRKMDGAEEGTIRVVATIGYVARGVVFSLVGVFLLRAAWQHDPKESRGLDGALTEIAQADYGDPLLGLTAAGLLAWALFRFAQARYRSV